MASSTVACSQDCSSPLTLCSGEPVSLDSTDFSSAFNEVCFSASNSAYFEFTTNNSVTFPGAFTPYEVSAEIIINNCMDAGIELQVTAGIYQPVIPGNACGVLTEISTCVTEVNQISLNSGELSPNTTYIIVVGLNPASNGFGCDVDVTLTGAPLEINAFGDANIPLGFSTPLEVFGATEEFGVENYVWAPNGSLDDFLSQSPEATPSNTTTYFVEGQVGDCLVTDQVVVTVDQAITVLNTFSPNGDGINDTWRILRIENFDSALINVFDRWGQLVYKTIGYTTPWDGTNEGKRLTTGTYYYVIELNSLEITSEPLTGFVVILN